MFTFWTGGGGYRNTKKIDSSHSDSMPTSAICTIFFYSSKSASVHGVDTISNSHTNKQQQQQQQAHLLTMMEEESSSDKEAHQTKRRLYDSTQDTSCIHRLAKRRLKYAISGPLLIPMRPMMLMGDDEEDEDEEDEMDDEDEMCMAVYLSRTDSVLFA
jgi:hypothetical protein